MGLVVTADDDQAAQHIDRLEVGRPVAGHVRVAFGVADARGATDALVGAGAVLLAAPVERPRRWLHSRLEAPAGLQLPLFEALEPETTG
jgi:lactoylglutathione lyase